MNEGLQLHVNGWKYGSWQTQRITRSLEQLAHSFFVTFTDRWESKEDIPIEAGDAVSISYDDEMITDGWIVDDNSDYSYDEYTLSFSGKSRTCDLVDCAAIHRGGQWKGQGLLKIAKDLCNPFGIEVTTNVSLGAAFSLFELNDGESVFQAISRAATRRGVLPLTKADGNLIFDRVGRVKIATKLEFGKNILRGKRRNDWRERFSTYIVKAQTSGTDNLFGSSAAQLKRSSSDEGCTRYRPTIIQADDEDSGSELQKRADWERNIRAGRAKWLTYTVQGWTHRDGLWEPNTLVWVTDKIERIDCELLVVEATMTKTEDEGSLTTLSLTFPEAFDVQPLPPPKKTTGSLY
jgi:prophage tail gpP-like protein